MVFQIFELGNNFQNFDKKKGKKNMIFCKVPNFPRCGISAKIAEIDITRTENNILNKNEKNHA